MRTFLAWTLRVTIWPVNSFVPDFLKVPMVAMIVLPCTLFRARTIAASMAIDRPEAIDAAPARRPERSGEWQPGDFLVSRGMMARPAGEESRSAPLPHRRRSEEHTSELQSLMRIS